MPCYCDTPDENDQVEIERRCKANMYFDATATLTPEQIENNSLCVVPLPDANTALCKICKVLTEDQMKSVSAYYYQIKWPYKTLHDWYKQHKIDDESRESK